MTDPNQIAELRGLVAKATPGPWEVQDGCSWRRIGTRFHDGDVLCPTVHYRDGHPDLTAEDGRRDDNLALIVALVNAAPALLDAAERVGRLEEAVRAYCDAFDAGTGTVYVEPLMRSLLTDTTHDTAQHGEGESR